MIRWQRRRGARSASRGPTGRWVPKASSRLPSADDAGVGEAAVAAVSVPEGTAVAVDGAPDEEAAVAAGGAPAVAAGGEGTVSILRQAVNQNECECDLGDPGGG